MKARIDYYCQPKTKTAEYESENIHLVVELPFIPAVGTMLKLTNDGDFIRVNDVMLDITKGGEGLCIGLEEPDILDPWLSMRSQGWQLG